MCRIPSRLTACLLAALATLNGRAEARSTVAAQVLSTLAGPSLSQQLRVVLRYYPGDGEAVVAAQIELPAATFRVEGGSSQLGRAQTVAAGLRVDYGGQPLAEVTVDTVSLQGRTGALGEAAGAVRLETSAGPQAAHEAELRLRVAPPLAVELEGGGGRLLPGQEGSLVVTLRNLDPQGRAIEALTWDWPAAIRLVAAEPAGLGPGLPAGSQAALTYRLRASPDAPPGVVAVEGVALGAGRLSSPLPDLEIRVGPSPEVALTVPAEGALAGRRVALAQAWRNVGAEALALSGIAIDVPDGFEAPEAALGDRRFVLAADGRRLQMLGELDLDPGAGVAVEVRGVPQRSGPLRFTGWYRVGDGSEWLPTRGEPLLAVGLLPAAGGAGRESQPADLALAVCALERAVEGLAGSLPAAAGSAIALVADDPGQTRNWIVEDALNAALLAAGYRLPRGEAAGPADARLHYRLLTAQVVYTPLRGGRNPLATALRRDASAAVLLRLEGSDGRLVWARRLEGTTSDRVSAGTAGWLGGSKGVERVELDPDFRLVEVGLSSLIAGGLVLVFFAP